MKKLFTLTLLIQTACAFAQNVPRASGTPHVNIPHASHKSTVSKDTVIESDTSKENKEPRYFYYSLNANVFVNSKGGAGKRFSPSVEVGRTYGIFDIGLATGRLNSLSKGADTTRFLEFRPTINIFSKGRFAEALCLGGGYVFKGKQGLMTEICNSINFNVSETVAVAVLQGYYYFDGTNSSRGTQYMGFNFTYNFLKKHSVNRQRKKAALVSDN
ncbi:MAG: hypothetical protein JWQ84_206 [Mucilaginibacter sp.]|nr:hypothetical protein [Mucilaginibacter sp.]